MKTNQNCNNDMTDAHSDRAEEKDWSPSKRILLEQISRALMRK
jgi:hypothetical protein